MLEFVHVLKRQTPFFSRKTKTAFLLLLLLSAGVQESRSSTSADYWSHECCILLNEGLGVPGESVKLEN